MPSSEPVKSGQPIKLWLSPVVAEWLRREAAKEAGDDRPSRSRVVERLVRQAMRGKRAG